MSGPWDTIDGIHGPNPGVPRVKAVHHATFVTYRPFESCRFCRKKFDDAAEKDGYEAPTEEYLCPHVRKNELDELLARGVRNEVVDIRMNTNVLPSGIVQVTVMWSETDGPKVEAERRRPSRL